MIIVFLFTLRGDNMNEIMNDLKEQIENYDKKNKTFSKRSKGTTSPFVDLNREALALSIDFLLKVLNKEEIDDKQLEVLVQGGSFGKIYSFTLTKTLSKNNNLSKTNIA